MNMGQTKYFTGSKYDKVNNLNWPEADLKLANF